MVSTSLQKLSVTFTNQREITKVLLGTAIMAVSANIQIPLSPVPITMHTVGLFLIALTFAPRTALITQISYLLVGFAGAPVFAGFAGGPAVLMGPTAGYLMAFPLAAFVGASLVSKFNKNSLFSTVSATLIGTSIIFLFGVSWLANYLGSFEKAFMFGLYPFVIPGLIKAAILSITVYGAKKSINSK